MSRCRPREAPEVVDVLVCFSVAYLVFREQFAQAQEDVLGDGVPRVSVVANEGVRDVVKGQASASAFFSVHFRVALALVEVYVRRDATVGKAQLGDDLETVLELVEIALFTRQLPRIVKAPQAQGIFAAGVAGNALHMHPGHCQDGVVRPAVAGGIVVHHYPAVPGVPRVADSIAPVLHVVPAAHTYGVFIHKAVLAFFPGGAVVVGVINVVGQIVLAVVDVYHIDVHHMPAHSDRRAPVFWPTGVKEDIPEHQRRVGELGQPQGGDGDLPLPHLALDGADGHLGSVLGGHPLQHLPDLVGAALHQHVAGRFGDIAADEVDDDPRQGRDGQEDPPAPAGDDEPGQSSGHDRPQGPEALQVDQVLAPLLGGEVLGEDGVVHRQGPAHAEAGYAPEQGQPEVAGGQGGEEAEDRVYQHRQLEADPPADVVGDGAPEPGPGQHAQEDGGADEARLSRGQAPLLDHARQGEGDKQHLHGVGGPPRPADGQQLALEGAEADPVYGLVESHLLNRFAIHRIPPFIWYFHTTSLYPPSYLPKEPSMDTTLPN